MVTVSDWRRESQPAANFVPVTRIWYLPARTSQRVLSRWTTFTSTVPSSRATVAPRASSASTCACARAGSVTSEPSENFSASSPRWGPTKRSPMFPARPTTSVTPATAYVSGWIRVITKAIPPAHAAAPTSAKPQRADDRFDG
jgi:hypothetical protein